MTGHREVVSATDRRGDGVFFLARFVHRDLDVWRVHLGAHMAWLTERAAAGEVAASGPVTSPTDPMAAMILVRADDRDAAIAVLETDPFVQHGVTEDLVVVGWNPFIGAFAAETEPPPQLAELLDSDRRGARVDGRAGS